MLRALTPLYHWHAAHGARFIERDGWQLPAAYTDAESEAAAARAGVGLADISAFAKLSLLGRGVSAVVQALLGDGPALKPRGVAAFRAGDPVLACRLTEDYLLLLAATPCAAGLRQCLANVPQAPVVQHEVTSSYAGICLVGPHTEDVLRQFTSLDLTAALPAGTCAETNFAGVHALLVRPPESHLQLVRIYVGWDLAEYVWQRLLEGSRKEQITPLGFEGLSLMGW
ncbi:MAG TPA: hypothetical protein VNK04_13410 [Gemmataceae bacterium]|nr:hypothetical protein [Gemmataceae bacterium]